MPSGTGNATRDGRRRAAGARAVGGGRWHGRLDLSKLMGDAGCVIARRLVPPEDCTALLEGLQLGAAARQQQDREDWQARPLPACRP